MKRKKVGGTGRNITCFELCLYLLISSYKNYHDLHVLLNRLQNHLLITVKVETWVIKGKSYSIDKQKRAVSPVAPHLKEQLIK